MMCNDYDLRNIVHVGAELGESPVWDAQKGLLYFVDIARGRINVLRPEGVVDVVHQSAARIGAVVLSDQGNLIFTEDASVAKLDPETGEVSWHTAAVQHGEHCRFNDGACDPQGRFVTGLMDESPGRKTGTLYRYDNAMNASVIHRGVGLPNGLAWSEAGDTLYFVDYVARAIFRTPYPPSGLPDAKEIFVETPAELDRPDGISLDQDGGLWVCQFNGGCLLRYDRNGCLSDRVAMPVPRPTSCYFGGQGLRTLFITTARFAMTPGELREFPDAGDLYVIQPDVAGCTRYVFKE